MAMYRIGIHQPSDAVTGTGPHIFNDETGMHYELCTGDDGRHYVAADHEDVGLVAWYDATLTDWDALEVAASESEEDYARTCDAQHAEHMRAVCPHDDIRDTGTFDGDGGHISECADCGDTWNGGSE